MSNTTRIHPTRFIFGILLLSVLALFDVDASNHSINHGVLSENDFGGETPPKVAPDGTQRKFDAETASGVSEAYNYSYDAEGNVHIDSAEYESFMDTGTSWFDKTKTEAEKKSLLEHEQLHFDISELIAKEMQANSEKIKKEAEDAINGDPDKKKAFKALIDKAVAQEQQIKDKKAEINDKETEIKDESDPAKKKTLEDEKKILEGEKKVLEDGLDETQNKLVDTIDKNSDTYNKLKAKEAKYQEDYDKDSKHSKDGKGQKKWANTIGKELTEWKNKQKNGARSRSENSLNFDAALNQLTITDDMIIDISGDVLDELVGATFLLPEFTLEGQTGFGAYLFSSADSMALLVDGSNNTLFSSQLNTLFYTPDNNQLFGFFTDSMFSVNNSLFLNDMEALLNSPSTGLATIAFTPDVDLFSLTSGFTGDGEVAISNSFHVSIPVPTPPMLVLFMTVIVLMFFNRKNRLDANEKPE
ncbi:MAG: hypothetical protein QNK36_20770 [Colwellia sp.]|nr:hypothetical protein [Colwellia sp.]